MCDIFKKPSTIQRTFFRRFLSIGEEKMSPLSKKRGHHDLRILRFERTASTAGVRTHGDFGSIPSPLHLAYSPMFRRYSIMNHSVPSTCFLHELQIKTVQHGLHGKRPDRSNPHTGLDFCRFHCLGRPPRLGIHNSVREQIKNSLLADKETTKCLLYIRY